MSAAASRARASIATDELLKSLCCIDVLKSNRTIYLVSELIVSNDVDDDDDDDDGEDANDAKLAKDDDDDEGDFTSCMTPEYHRPSGPGAQTFVPIIERFAKRRPVDILQM